MTKLVSRNNLKGNLKGETEYLCQSSKNRQRLLCAIKRADKGETLKFRSIDELREMIF